MQSPFEVQGSGAGRFPIGLGKVEAIDTWVGRVRLAVELNDAETRPATATSRAKMRTAAFIFGNLSSQDFGNFCFPFEEEPSV